MQIYRMSNSSQLWTIHLHTSYILIKYGLKPTTSPVFVNEMHLKMSGRDTSRTDLKIMGVAYLLLHKSFFILLSHILPEKIEIMILTIQCICWINWTFLSWLSYLEDVLMFATLLMRGRYMKTWYAGLYLMILYSCLCVRLLWTNDSINMFQRCK